MHDCVEINSGNMVIGENPYSKQKTKKNCMFFFLNYELFKLKIFFLSFQISHLFFCVLTLVRSTTPNIDVN